MGDALEVARRRSAALAEGAPPFVFPGDDGAKLKDGTLSRQFARCREQAGIRKGLTFHGLRHTFGSYSVMRGMDIYRLKEIMGHADVKTTMKYARLRPASLRPDMERCFGGGVLQPGEGKGGEAEGLRREVAGAPRGDRGAGAQRQRFTGTGPGAHIVPKTCLVVSERADRGGHDANEKGPPGSRRAYSRVEPSGFEPLASAVRLQRSTN